MLPISVSSEEMEATWAILVLTGYGAGHVAQGVDGGLDCHLDALLEGHGVGAGRDVLEAFADDGLAEDGGGGGAIASDVVGLGGDFLGELGAHVLEGVAELDLLGDGDAIVNDEWGAVFAVENDAAAAGAEGDSEGLGEDVDAHLERASGLFVKNDLLRHRKLLASSFELRAFS